MQNNKFEYLDPPIFKPSDSYYLYPYCLELLIKIIEEEWAYYYDKDI